MSGSNIEFCRLSICSQRVLYIDYRSRRISLYFFSAHTQLASSICTTAKCTQSLCLSLFFFLILRCPLSGTSKTINHPSSSRSLKPTQDAGNKYSIKPNGQAVNDVDETDHNDAQEKLDLGDLDLSRIRLTKKDLETLSNITPALPKHCQDQLLAQLPPNQARKLSRTLSMQNSPTSALRVYQRSLSGGRDNGNPPDEQLTNIQATTGKGGTTVVVRRSLSRTRDSQTRSDEANSFYPPNEEDRYEYGDESNPHRSTVKDFVGRPPSGCLSPPPSASPHSLSIGSGTDSLRRRPSQRRISRFLRPDFFDPQREETIRETTAGQREAETQNVLKEIREKSRERGGTTISRVQRESSLDPFVEKSYYSNMDADRRKSSIPHVRSMSVDPTTHRAQDRCESVVRETTAKYTFFNKKEPTLTNENGKQNSSITDLVLDELQAMSSKTARESDDRSTDTSSRSTTTLMLIESKCEEPIGQKSVQQLNGDITPDISTDRPKKVSKLLRPKSYPSKEPSVERVTKKISPDKMDDIREASPAMATKDKPAKKLIRPKSYPASKLTPPKELSKSTVKINGDASRKTSPLSDISQTTKSSETSEKVIKKVKIVKKVIKADASTSTAGGKSKSLTPPNSKAKEKDFTPEPVIKAQSETPSAVSEKEKSPEKKPNRGFLYTIGQKFEKLRETSKTKVKKSLSKNVVLVAPEESNSTTADSYTTDCDSPLTISDATKSAVKSEPTSNGIEPNAVKAVEQRKSRIDTMIRTLRERSVSRSPTVTESCLIKRAVSVEDMTGTSFNKKAVNRVLGLFRKMEKDSNSNGLVKNTCSSGNVNALLVRERPKSTGFVSKLRKVRPYTGAISDIIVKLRDEHPESPSPTNPPTDFDRDVEADKLNENFLQNPTVKPPTNVEKVNKCQECEVPKVTKRMSTIDLKSDEERERMRNNRKGLLLDFTKLETLKPPATKHPIVSYPHLNNNNHMQSAHVHHHSNNNYHEINDNHLLTPSFDSMTQYSSDSKSPHDDCTSTSTFMSPSDEPELYFDDWSMCSEENFVASSPSFSRMSRGSQLTSPPGSSAGMNDESVIDRIKRRSFYCRFNENKPKRTNSVAGTVPSRNYYRDTMIKSRPSADRMSSPPMLDSPTKSSEIYARPHLPKPTSSSSSSSNNYPYHSHHHHHHHHHSSDVQRSSSVVPSAVTSIASRSLYDDDLRRYRPSEYYPNKPAGYSASTAIRSGSSSRLLATSSTSATPTDYKYTPSSTSDFYTKSTTPTPRLKSYFTPTTTSSKTTSNSSSSSYDPLLQKYGTYNPKRRTSSYATPNGAGSGTTSSGTTPSYESEYATMGRKARPYDSRSLSLMDSSTIGGAYRKEQHSRSAALSDYGSAAARYDNPLLYVSN